MSSSSNMARRYELGFSLVELMVGMTIGFIAMVVIVQSMSVFESHKRTTTAAVDAQENGLIALMAIEADIRKAASGYNHAVSFSCQKFFSYYQDKSGTGAPATVGAFSTIPVLIQDSGSNTDTIEVTSGARFTGSVATKLVKTMSKTTAPALELEVERAYDFLGNPVSADDPPADLILVANPDSHSCSLMQVSSLSGTVLTIANGPDGKNPEYNAPHTYMTANNWPGFGSESAGYPTNSLVFRVGSTASGAVHSASYSINTDNSLQVDLTTSSAASSTEILSSEIVALQAQYGVSSSKTERTINDWVDGTGGTWGVAALTASTAAAIDNRQRIKAIRIAIVARSSKRDAALVSHACTDSGGTLLYYGPCSWDGGPAIALGSASDTEWQHYRYRVYQTVVPMRNVLWPDL